MDEEISIEPEPLAEGLAGLVKPELQPGERLLWAGAEGDRPSGIARTPASALLWIVTSFGLSSATFYAELGPLRGRFPRFDGLLFLVGVVSGLVGVVTSLVWLGAHVDRWTGRHRALRRTYALTDRRAIIWVPRRTSTAVEVFAFHRGSIKNLNRVEFPDGSGDVRFGNPHDESYLGPTGFEKIAEVRRVEELVRRTLIDPVPQADA